MLTSLVGDAISKVKKMTRVSEVESLRKWFMSIIRARKDYIETVGHLLNHFRIHGDRLLPLGVMWFTCED